MRRWFYAHRKELQKAKKVRAMRKSAGKERRWMREINHQLSHAIVSHATAQGVETIRLERLAGIRQRTVWHAARTSGGAKQHKQHKTRKNTCVIATWTCHQRATFITYQAERVGIKVEWMDPAHTRQMGPACFELNGADDRRYVCTHCG